MGRNSSIPVIFDYCCSISIGELIQWGYFRGDDIVTGKVTYYLGHHEILVLYLAVSFSGDFGLVRFQYFQGGIEFDYFISLVSRKSNLGRGLVWHFRCPFSGRMAKKLHFLQGHFKHRSCVSNGYYQIQVVSKFDRVLFKKFGL